MPSCQPEAGLALCHACCGITQVVSTLSKGQARPLSAGPGLGLSQSGWARVRPGLVKDPWNALATHTQIQIEIGKIYIYPIALHQQTLEILVEDIVTIYAIGIHRYLVDTIDVVDAHRDSVNIWQ